MAQDTAIVAAVASGVLNYIIPGAGKLEELLGTGGKFITKGAGGRVTNTITGLLGEGVQEALEEGSVPLLGNLAVQKLDKDQETFEGVGEQAGMGAVGGIFGGAAAATQPVESRSDSDLREALNEGFQEGQEKDIVTSVDRVFAQMTVADSIQAMEEELVDTTPAIDAEPILAAEVDQPTELEKTAILVLRKLPLSHSIKRPYGLRMSRRAVSRQRARSRRQLHSLPKRNR